VRLRLSGRKAGGAGDTATVAVVNHEHGWGQSVFADPSGRRWRRTRRVLVAVALAAVVILALVGPQLWASPRMTPAAADTPVLAREDVGDHPPVFGRGPLERVVRLTTEQGVTTSVEPFTGEKLGNLDAESVAKVGSAKYAIQRYGYSQTATKTISLTYDDGVDPVVTPALLDLLGKNKVPATFFLIGDKAALAPDVVRRMANEGHGIGLHTMTHPRVAEVPDWRQQLEVVQTERVLRSITGREVGIWRAPYTGPDEHSLQDTVTGLLRAQRLGYVHADYDFDTLDWEHDARPNETAADIPLPDFSTGENITVLMHDGGGPDRMRTVQYTARLIDAARAAGYSFHTMPQVNPLIAQANAPVSASALDRISETIVVGLYDWPRLLMKGLFLIAVGMTLVVGVANVMLAAGMKWRRRRRSWPHPAEIGLSVSVVIAAYNEEPVIARTLRSILLSDYPLTEVLVVDDGSSDGTMAEVLSLAAEDPRVRLYTQPNGGKATALNNGIGAAQGEIIVTLDADTIVMTDTISNLVRHFAVGKDVQRLGAVAGVVRVGNRSKNLLTRWQALEYLTQIGLERSAQDALGAISIIPGACAAWRKEAIVAAGGYSTATLAEDCDLALTLHELGWRVTQDTDAVALTEAPETVDDLLKQRSRWTYGTLQAMWKHRRMMLRPKFGMLGMYVLPSYVLSILVPLVFLPFVVVMTVNTLQTDGPGVLAGYALLFLAVHVVLAAIAARLMEESWGHVAMVPIYRVVYEPLRAYLLYTSVDLAWKGRSMGWNKLVRTGSMDLDTVVDAGGARPASRLLPLRARAAKGLSS
jgi:cellulose synthase/poly-beta-1,6-N-acetylglucosamine synthase-like glycosyltransferase/peptidoglycan/xylan/chitin deacetylase (PgdA/CDA1 family)